jgi:D-inositol-3-phosphate glycosyltransferase
MISVHTSPLDQPGTGDAGGLNVYLDQVARELARRNVAVEVFTRAATADHPPTVELVPGVTVHNVVTGPVRAMDKSELPGQLCALTAALLHSPAGRHLDRFDLVHSHYWLAGQVGWVAKERWGVPLVHTMHTMGRVKNANLAVGDIPEPAIRLAGEAQVVDAADRLVANTPTERAELIEFYDADPDVVDVVNPGVDLQAFSPGPVPESVRAALGIPEAAAMILFVGRVQALKAPDTLVSALARMPAVASGSSPSGVAGDRFPAHLVIVGGASGSAKDGYLDRLHRLTGELGVSDHVHFVPAQPRAELAMLYRAADVVGVPSHNESFGLVAVEAQACGTPVVAADVGGLRTAVRDGRSGLLVAGHDPDVWAAALRRVVVEPALRQRLSVGAREHARGFSWSRTVDGLMSSYRAAIAAPRDGLADVG